MIRIKYQDSFHQYDGDWNPITAWDSEIKEWVVLPWYENAYKNNEIDWGSNYDFPRGIVKRKRHKDMSIISRETFEKFSDEEKRKVYELNKELSILRNENGDKYHYLTGSLDNLNALFGKENLQPKPKIKTWEDVAAQREYNIDVELNKIKNAWIGYPICDKMIATAKIAKLIELGYGGMVTEEEKCSDIPYFAIFPVLGTSQLQIADNHSTNIYSKDFVSFHTRQQAEEFMSYPENVELVKQYHMSSI